MAILINGKEIANKICEDVKLAISTSGIMPCLSVILVGDNPASNVYVNSKEKKAKELGMRSLIKRLPENTKEDDLIDLIKSLNDDPSVDGILVQLPLPKHINQNKIFCIISPKKDVDGLTEINMGKLISGIEPYHYPCTPAGIIQLLNSIEFQFSGKNAVVIGRSNIVGKPIAQMLMKLDMTVTVCHSKTKNIENFTKLADLVVVAIGKEKYLKSGMLKNGSVVIDVGINRTEKGLVGDVDFDDVKNVAGFITPVPGGVGPMTIAMLMRNCLNAALRYRT